MTKKKIVLGVTSSIAAYKACDLIRLFVKNDCNVYPVLTRGAKEFVTPLTLKILSGNPVSTGFFDSDEMEHIDLKNGTKALVIAPATANIIGKLANGIADDVLSTTYLTVDCPVIIAPAMNPNMWSHSAVQENVEKLKKHGVIFVEPAEGEVVCGDQGDGKLAKVKDIFEVVKKTLE